MSELVSQEYDHQVASRLISAIGNGITVESFCKASGVPFGLIVSWRKGLNGAPPEFGEHLTEAQRIQAEIFSQEVVSLADQMQDIGDAAYNKKFNELREQGVNPKNIARLAQAARRKAVDVLKEQIASRKWLASKLDPDRFGTSPVVANRSVTNNVHVHIQNLSDEELRQLQSIQKSASSDEAFEVDYTVEKEEVKQIEEKVEDAEFVTYGGKNGAE